MLRANYTPAGEPAGGRLTNKVYGIDLTEIAIAVNTQTAITPEQYGAVGNGVANDTAALQNAFDALGPGKVLYIDAGKIYAHNAILYLTTTGGTIRGGGEIRATVGDAEAFIIQGDHVTVEDVKFTCPSAATRGLNTEHHKVILDGTVGTVLRRVNVDGAKGGGIKIQGSSYFQLDFCRTINTFADAFHITDNSTHGVVSNCHAENCGDDGFAVVSYESDVTPCTDISINGFTVVNGAARGVTVVGGADIFYSNGLIDTTVAAGVYVACEPSYLTLGVDNVAIDSVHIVNANTGAPTTDHGAIMVYNGRNTGFDVIRVSIGNLSIHNTDPAASRQIGLVNNGTGDMAGIILGSTIFSGTGPATRLSTTGITSSEYVADNSITGQISTIYDTNGNVALALNTAAGAVNHVSLLNNSAGQAPWIYVEGTDSNIPFFLLPKGSGGIKVWANSQNDMDLVVDGTNTDVGWYVTTKGAGRFRVNGRDVGAFGTVPSTATSTGRVGQMAADASWLYICYATNLWRRVAIASW